MNLRTNGNTSHEDVCDWVALPDGKIAHRYDIIGTPTIAYEVWEPYGGHSTLTTHEDQWLGSMVTRPLPPEIEAMPGWIPGKYWPTERIEAVRAFHAALEAEAERIIRATFPQDFVC